MNRRDDRHERVHITEHDLDAGFDAVMGNLERLPPQEIADLRRQADAAELGHDAYMLGVRSLEHGEFDQAQHWLRMAVRYQVAGAQRVLDEITVHDVEQPATPALDRTGEPARTAAIAHPGLESDPGHRPADFATASQDAPAAEAVGAMILRPSYQGLAQAVSVSAPGSLSAVSLNGGVSLGPGNGHRITFGRDRERVDVCIGEYDISVSRRHGALTYDSGHWRLQNIGQRPIRIADRQLLYPNEEPLALPVGHSQLFIQTAPNRQHLLEVFITGPGAERPVPQHTATTRPPTTWPLSPEERLALIVLSQRYLLREPQPQPLSWSAAAAQLAEVQPDGGWTHKRVERLIGTVRNRLSRAGVAGLTRAEVGEPVGNALNHNLIQELLQSTTLAPFDLALLDAVA